MEVKKNKGNITDRISNRKKTNKKEIPKNKKIIMYLVSLVVIAYVIYTIYLLIKEPTNVFTVEEGKLYNEETNIGYVIRNEKVVKGENYKNGMEQIKSEGERAAKDENIFRYYSANEESLKQKISELDQKIQEAMQNTEGILPSDMKALESQIDEKVENLNQLTDSAKLEEYKKEISSYVNKKAKIAGDLSPQGLYLKQLIDERKNYETELNSGAEYVKAPMSGVVSYKVDGLEDKLTPDMFSSLSKKYLESLDLKTGKIVASNNEAGKVIDNFCCYIATISDSEDAKNAEVGQKVSVRLSNNAEISAEITNIIKEDNEEILLILKINEQIEELINYRKISFELIWWSKTGLKIPNQSIVTENYLNYVVRNRAGYLSKLLVKVTKTGDKYSIVEPYDTEKLKELGFSNSEIISYKKITLYDEILLNPDLSEVE